MTRIGIAVIVSIVATLSYISSAIRAQECSRTVVGAIEDEVWDDTQRPYCITGDCIVGKLTIRPGVTIQFLGDYRFRVGGVLTAIGTKEEPILFTKGPEIEGWGGIFFDRSSPNSVLSGCIVEGSRHGGIRLENSTPAIRQCTIRQNSIVSSEGRFEGAGIHALDIEDGVLRIEDCQITGNHSTFQPNSAAYPSTAAGGGGVYLDGNVVLLRCVIANNGCQVICNQGAGCLAAGGGGFSARGGGIYARGNVELRNCEVRENTSSSSGRGVLMSGSSYGGGLYFEAGTLHVTNSIFACNESAASCDCSGARPFSGGIHVSSGSVLIENTSIVRNTNEGMRVDGGSVSIMNSILYENVPVQLSGAAMITYSDVEGGHEGIGNFDQNPVFAGAECHDIRVITGSSCIDAGDPDEVFQDGCLPPGRGTKRNDVGAHGGPGNCNWEADSCPPAGALVCQVPGDCNQDRQLDISDGVCLLGFLFAGSPARLPCGDGSASSLPNVTLLDSNGSGKVDMADAVRIFGFLFLGKPPPAQGSDCMLIEGCPGQCD